MVWLDRLHVIFIVLISILCINMLRSSKQYGQKLRRLRNECRRYVKMLQDNDHSFTPTDVHMIVKSSDGKIVYDNTESQAMEMENFLADEKYARAQVYFRHLPDVEKMTGAIPFYKDTINGYQCASCVR